MHVFRLAMIGFGLGFLGFTAVLANGVEVLPEASGKRQVVAVCTQCHGIDLLAQRRSPDEWSQVVSQMVGNGAKMTDEQFETIVAYLSTNMTPVNDVSASAAGH